MSISFLKNLLKFFTKVNYKNVISLGYNCEVSFYIQKYCKNLNSSLFSWAYVFSIEALLKALTDLDNLFTKNISEPTPLYKDNDYNIAFHGNLPDLDLINPEIKFSEEVLENDRKNTIEKINYLKGKFKEVLNGNKTKIVFYKARYKDLKLLKNLEKENLYFRGVEKYNPEEQSNSDTYQKDWFEIFSEFNIQGGKNNG